MRDRFTISPELYAKITFFALAALAAIVFTGSAVRMTGSGLGCPDWPQCHGQKIPPLGFHTYVEYGNRLITGVVGIIVIAAALGAFFRRPYRRHLVILGALLPVGVIAQAALGALVVEYDLNPYLVMNHFILSMLLLDASFALWWCNGHDLRREKNPSRDPVSTWAVRALIPFGQLTVVLGTMSTAAGPHTGDHEGELIHRLNFEGSDTLSWLVTRHGAIAALFGIAAVAVWFLVRRPGAERRAQQPLTVLCLLLAAQGVLGFVQYQLELPAGLVWIHVVLATLTWLTTLWAVGSAGRLAPREEQASRPRKLDEMHQPV
jgi:cytochrome c oxidase assembly protein subunit 15